jgi:hypothetical protein
MTNLATPQGATSTAAATAPGWAAPVDALHVGPLREPAVNINVEGRHVVGPLQGFGPLLQKTYRIRLEGASVTPAEVMTVWRTRFPDFWPRGNRFCAPIAGIAPGEVALLNLGLPGGARLATGMLVIFSDDTSFTLMTPQGHFESGWITFSAYDDHGVTVVQVQSLARINDPLYDVGFGLFGHRLQEWFWHETLRAVAAAFGVEGVAWAAIARVDGRRQWSQVVNTWHNAAVRTALYQVAAPLRLIRRAVAGNRQPLATAS